MGRHYRDSYDEIEKWRDALRETASPQEMIQAIELRIQQESDPERLEIFSVFLAHEYRKQGNKAAAAAIMENHPQQEIFRWYMDWRRKNRGKSGIAVLKEKLRNESHPLKIKELRSNLAAEYVFYKDYAAATAIHLEDFEADPDSALPLQNIAFNKLEFERQPEEAMHFVNRALEVAVRTGNFQRMVLGTKARIALRLKDYGVIEDVLKQVMDTKLTRRNADLGVERDFFDALPTGSIDPELAQAYDDFCRARGKSAGADGDGSEPPKWDDHEESGDDPDDQLRQ